MKRILLLTAGLLMFAHSSAQNSLNNYKYVIVEKQFHFQNEADEYDLNNLVRYLFSKYGFNPIFEGTPLPDDLKANYCLALQSEVRVKGALRTKATVELKNCDGITVYVSPEGITKVKDFRRAYDLAIRATFENLANLDYYYVPDESVISQGKSIAVTQTSEKAEKEIEQLKAEIKELKEEKSEEKKEDVKTEIEAEKSDDESATYGMIEAPALVAKKDKNSSFIEVLDPDSNVIMTLIPSGRKDLYIVKDRNAVLYKEDGNWMYSETIDEEQKIKKLNIKFQ